MKGRLLLSMSHGCQWLAQNHRKNLLICRHYQSNKGSNDKKNDTYETSQDSTK